MEEEHYFLAEHSGKNQMGKIGPSGPLEWLIAVQASIHVTRSRSHDTVEHIIPDQLYHKLAWCCLQIKQSNLL